MGQLEIVHQGMDGEKKVLGRLSVFQSWCVIAGSLVAIALGIRTGIQDIGGRYIREVVQESVGVAISVEDKKVDQQFAVMVRDNERSFANVAAVDQQLHETDRQITAELETIRLQLTEIYKLQVQISAMRAAQAR
jgi:hypothetical protein